MTNIPRSAATLAGRIFSRWKHAMTANTAVDSHLYTPTLRLVSAPWVGWYFEKSG
ncbi:hypothetical protein GCM10027038_15270 [Arthrobacter bambusae]